MSPAPMQPDAAIAEQAAEWLVRLAEVNPDDTQHAAFAAWQRSDPRHAAAVERMAGMIERLQGLRQTVGGAHAAHTALDAGCTVGKVGRTRRRAIVALVLALAIPGWLASRVFPPEVVFADVHTAIGHGEHRELADGSHIDLKGGSALNLRFDATERRVALVRGEILVDVARDVQRPFVIATRYGEIRALGTRFAVRSDDTATVLTMLESKVAVHAASTAAAAETVVVGGQRVRIDAGGIGTIAPIDVRSVDDAWRLNQLVVQDMPLPDVLDELARQRPGLIRYDRGALAGIRVTAVLPLDDTDQALRLLVTSQRLRVDMFTPWLVYVTALP
ncbi:MAG: DUF4880 domain-containing protein [Deltaproteobacteria bacterium]|nr:DUF4880 domain-containing protein [Deltaproteobacteria bacterium]